MLRRHAWLAMVALVLFAVGCEEANEVDNSPAANGNGEVVEPTDTGGPGEEAPSAPVTGQDEPLPLPTPEAGSTTSPQEPLTVPEDSTEGQPANPE